MTPDDITFTAVVGLLALGLLREAREWALFVGRRWRVSTAAVPKVPQDKGAPGESGAGTEPHPIGTSGWPGPERRSA